MKTGGIQEPQAVNWKNIYSRRLLFANKFSQENTSSYVER